MSHLTRVKRSIADLEEALYWKRGDFTTGGVLSSEREVMEYPASSNNYYRSKSPTFPVTVPPQSTPDSSWESVGDASNMTHLLTNYAIAKYVNTVADLRSLNGEVGKYYFVREHTDGRGADGGGLFQCVQKQSLDDNGVWISSPVQNIMYRRVTQSSGVRIEWFGGVAEWNDVDTTPILQNAQKYSGRTIYFNEGSYYFSAGCKIKRTFRIVGSGTAATHWRNINTQADEGVWYFDDGTTSSWQEYTTVENIDFSADRVSIPTQSAIVMRHLSLSYFINCTFWYTTLYGSDIHFLTFQRCRFLNSKITINEASVSPTFPINEGLNLIDCYLVRCPVDVTDLTDLRYIGTTQFYGEFGIKFTSHRPKGASAESNGYPIMLVNSVIDNIDGPCLDLNRVAVGHITGCFFSGGRVLGTPAVKLSEVIGLSFTGNILHFTGQENITMYNVQSGVFSNNQFSAANGFAIKLQYCRNLSFGNNLFDTVKLEGGWYDYQGGINYADDSSESIVYTGNLFLRGKPALVGQHGDKYRAVCNVGLADKL